MAGEREEGWHPARLIPTAGIRGQEEQERQATSSLLAVMGAVPEFGRAMLAELGAPRGRISTFAEVQLKDADGKLSIPDGAILVERGQTRWSCLVEVKTGGVPLKSEQVRDTSTWLVSTTSTPCSRSRTRSPLRPARAP